MDESERIYNLLREGKTVQAMSPDGTPIEIIPKNHNNRSALPTHSIAIQGTVVDKDRSTNERLYPAGFNGLTVIAS